MKRYKQLNLEELVTIKVLIYSYLACRLKNKIAPAIIQHDIERDIGLKIGKDAIYEFIYRF